MARAPAMVRLHHSMRPQHMPKTCPPTPPPTATPSPHPPPHITYLHRRRRHDHRPTDRGRTSCIRHTVLDRCAVGLTGECRRRPGGVGGTHHHRTWRIGMPPVTRCRLRWHHHNQHITRRPRRRPHRRSRHTRGTHYRRTCAWQWRSRGCCQPRHHHIVCGGEPLAVSLRRTIVLR